MWVLTCTLASHQVLALRLVRVDGGDGDDVLSVRVQVRQDMGGFIATQDGLVRETERKGKCYNVYFVALITMKMSVWSHHSDPGRRITSYTLIV